MNVLLYFISFVGLSEISLTRSQEATSNQIGLGASSCTYVGDEDVECNYDGSVLNILPKSCTSFVFNGVIVNANHEVSQTTYPIENDALLDKMLKLGKNVYLLYKRDFYEDWITVLAGMACNDTNALNDAKGINAYLEKHPGIKGLLLQGLEANQDSLEVVGLTEYLKKYIEILKKETKLEIALCFRAYYFYMYYKQHAAPWLTFKTLDPCVDFYFFTLTSFYNECTENTRKGGVFLIDGSAELTFEKLSSAIGKSTITTEKSFFSYVLVPKTNKEKDDWCVVNNERMCTCPNESTDWCADTQETLYKKGKWFKDHGSGFCANVVNLDDPHGRCGCGSFPGYNAILAGFNGSASAPSCPLFDRP